MKSKKKPVPHNTLRIIGGQWRGRKVSFPTIEGLRPTPDRVRETLFNWLMHDIRGANCLDLFAGSGALGLEALSRGAKHVHFVDISQQSCQLIKQHLALFQCEQADVWQSSAIDAISKINGPLDIIFLDPPFRKGLLLPTIEQLIDSQLINEESQLYMEVESEVNINPLEEIITIRKNKKAGDVTYVLGKLKT